MTPCSEQEGDRRQAEADARQLRFERAHDRAWSELQMASPASAGDIWARLAALEGDKVPVMMAEALRALTDSDWSKSVAQKALIAVEKMKPLLRLVADEIANEILTESDDEF